MITLIIGLAELQGHLHKFAMPLMILGTIGPSTWALGRGYTT